ncbi:MAG: competence protein ComGC [Flavobacteriales bacterium]|jgi:competence protein ComGC
MPATPYKYGNGQGARVPSVAGFSLIEMIGVLAVISLISLVLVPVLIKKLDRVALIREEAMLLKMAEGYKAYASRNRSFPDDVNFVQLLADELGMHPVDVSLNQKGRSRLMVIDPRLRMGINTNQVLPYVQSIVGSIEPINPRVLILSSLGDNYPVHITNGVAASSAVFDEMWALDVDSVPATWSPWNRGRGEDLIIQRLHIADLFVPLMLGNDRNTQGLYSVDSLSTNSMPATSPRSVEGYFIVDTVLGLHDIDGDLKALEILHQPTSFVFEMGIWRSRFEGVDGGDPVGFNLQVASETFAAAPWNPNAKSISDPATQAKIVAAMTLLMDEYNLWSAAGFPTHPIAKQNLVDAENALSTYTKDLLFNP